ncbi:hypothetical protein WKR88_20580 [Trinickia caryophylli]|uniref:hypothetical protein n=1 Tax=Trinickia caryophylli TaxID=28094 RepID=UPI000A14B8A3|nr:hypothetical protein [Trinickia caryophylli]PMS10384.1 hypothetical protein C0Z17_20020 [Trinickia caryophylli]TRX19493.1 hypothetical protein FNF07_15560 [Trinickia caryophylli]WQE13198.1 hypothetical protein U0034_07395 [Trinickia caryophylli]
MKDRLAIGSAYRRSVIDLAYRYLTAATYPACFRLERHLQACVSWQRVDTMGYKLAINASRVDFPIQ